MKRCAFCQQDAVKKGGEHIWDDWLNRSISVTKHNFRYSDTSGTRRQYSRKQLDEKLPVVCHDCNTRWMSQLTHQVKQGYGSAIVEGSQFCILPSGIDVLAAFLFMKACVAASQIADGSDAFFTRAERERLRTSLAVPAIGVRMWIAAFKGEALHSGRFVPAILSTDRPPLDGVEYFTFTYMIGHLLLQLLAARWKSIHHGGIMVIPMLRPHEAWNEACTQFWPPPDVPGVVWPPPEYFTDATLNEFVERFTLPINVPLSQF